MSHHCPLESGDSDEKSNVDSFFVLALLSCVGKVFVSSWISKRVSLCLVSWNVPFVCLGVGNNILFWPSFLLTISISLSLYDVFLKNLWLCLPCYQSRHLIFDLVHYPSTPHTPMLFSLSSLLTLVHFWSLADAFPCPSLTLLYLLGQLTPSLNSITNTLCPSTQTAEHR